MRSVSVKVHKLNKNIEQWLLSDFQTMYTSIDYDWLHKIDDPSDGNFLFYPSAEQKEKC